MYQIGDEEISRIQGLFKTKRLFRYQGKETPTECSRFEKNFSQYIGNNFSLFVTSGTNALVLALRGLGIKPGDEVIVPSYTFVATPAAVIQVGATPIIASVGNKLTLDPQQLEKKITSKTKAIIAVHMDGHPSEMTHLQIIAKKHGLMIIEDVAQAIGGSFKKAKLGSIGDASCFSFNADKIITCGEGGLVSFKNENHYKKALALHDIPITYGASFKDYLADVPREVGYSMRMSEISAVIVDEQLLRLDSILDRLRANRIALVKEIKHREKLLTSDDWEGECATHIHFKLNDPIAAGEFAKELTKGGVMATPLYARPSHCFWMWQDILGQENKDLSWDRLHLSSLVRVAVDFNLPEDQLIEQSKLINTRLGPYVF